MPRVSFLIKLQASDFPLPNAKHGSGLMTSWPKEHQIYKNHLKTLKKNFPGGGNFTGGKKGEIPGGFLQVLHGQTLSSSQK